MNEHTNLFKFSLQQNNVLLCEKIFNADNYNPHTRYSVDIRNVLPTFIIRLQKILSKKRYSFNLDVGCDKSYDLYSMYFNILKSYPNKVKRDMEYNPYPHQYEIENNKIIRGVECKIGLYINDKPIVERTFFVDGFNPLARWSIELLNEVIDITDIISDQIKTNDVKNMWDDYDLINIKRLNINQIREFTPKKRIEMLKSINR